MGNFTGFLKHGGNYLIASVATSALAFISIPVYTHLLTPEDYGVISIFMGVVGLLGSIMSFSADRSVSRYFFDQKNELDFKRFVGTSSILAMSFFILNSILLFVFAEEFGHVFGLSKNVVYLIIPVSLINIIGLTFEQIYGPLKKSKQIAISSFLKAFLGFVLSVFFIFIFKKDKFYGQIIGQIVAGLVIIFFLIRLIKPYFKWSFDISYIKYIFIYSVPLIPYALSGVIIEQFGKVAIGGSQGMSEAGFYNLALSVSSIVSIAIAVTHQAWNPFYFEYMNSKNYAQLDNDFLRIIKITIIVAFGVAAFGKEIGLILAKKEFSGSLYLIPVFTIGYVFYQLSYAYLRNFGFSKSTHFMTLTVLFSGISNVVLNIFLIKAYGELGAAVSFVLSYFLMFMSSWFINTYFVKLHATPLKRLLIPLSLVIPFYVFLYFVMDIQSNFGAIILKVISLSILISLLFWTDRKKIHLFSKSILIKIFQSKVKEDAIDS
jgi:O-antigen/teichoic acid export membrane protein